MDRLDGPENGRKRPGSSASGMQVAGAGFQFTAVVLVSAFAGIWLDRKLGTTPWMVIALVFSGAALGFYLLYRNLMTGQRLGDRQQAAERRDTPE
jgi:ATP synthase protein I